MVNVPLQTLPPVGQSNAATLGLNNRRFDRLGWLNVRDYGATGVGSDDRAAIQSAIDAVPADFAGLGGAVLFFPKGNYGIDCTTQGLIMPNNKSITLVGDGNPTTVSAATTVIRRLTGSNPVMSNPDVDTNSRFRGSLQNLRISGGGHNGRVIYFKRMGDAYFYNCRFGSNGVGSPGVEFASAWNCQAIKCHFGDMGDLTTSAAVRINTVGDPGDGTTGGFYFHSCEWERNKGTDLHIGGSTYESIGVMVVGGKMEGNPGNNAPMIRFGENARHNKIMGMRLYHTSAAGDADAIKHDGAGADLNAIIGCEITYGGSAAGTYYLINHLTGKLTVVGCSFGNNAGSLTSAWRIGGSVAAPSGTFGTPGFNPGGAVGAGNTYIDYTQNKRFSDGRAGAPGPQMAV